MKSMSGAVTVSRSALAELRFSPTTAKEDNAMKTLAHSLVRSDLPVMPRSMSWATLADWWIRKRTLAAVRHLDNHLRRDIGLDPTSLFGGTEAALRMIAMTAWR
jgi:hypothetical protein